jgi:hypothetical protein
VRLFPALLAFLLCANAAADTGISGRVVNAQTHEPVRRAVVKVYTASEQWNEFTDGEGRFKFPSLVRGEYTLVAHRDGFTDRAYKVESSDFDDSKELPIELHKQGLITGRVVDGSGQPLQRAKIEALNTRTSGAQVQAVGSAETNDLGEYRLSGLDPGIYRLRATCREGRENEFDSTPLTIATALFGSPDKPTELAVDSGSVTSGINFVLIAVRPVVIHGALHTEAGVLSEPVTLWIAGQSGEGGHNGRGRDGVFEIRDIGPGTYTVSAQTLSKSARLFGTTSVSVRDADVNGVDIMLRPNPRLEGQIRVEDGSLPDVKIGSILFHSQTPGIGIGLESAKPDENGTFVLSLNPGEYVISFDSKFSDVQKVTFDDRSVTNWKIKIDPGAGSKKLMIVVKPKAPK